MGALRRRRDLALLTPPQPAPRLAPGVAAAAIAAVKVHGTGDTMVRALDEVTVEFRTGEFTAIMGPSGSGKSTLMHCLAGIDRLTSGQIIVGDTDLTGLNADALTTFRRDRIGFVFQAFNLIPTLTTEENITLPLAIAEHRVDHDWLDLVVDSIGLRPRLRHRPAQLSGGEEQRVASARGVINRPDVVFADEPTGNLDSKCSTAVLSFLRHCVQDLRQTLVLVTHDPVVAAYADRIIFLADGRVAGELVAPSVEKVLEFMKHSGP